jgi:hypothetical protein
MRIIGFRDNKYEIQKLSEQGDIIKRVTILFQSDF